MKGMSVWPLAITFSLLAFVAVQVAFAVVAVENQDEVVPSYTTEAR